MSILQHIGAFIFGAALSISSFLGFHPSTAPAPEQPQFGAALPNTTAVFETSLASPITSSASSLTLTANSVRGGGTISGYTCFTIDEGTSNAETVCGTVSGTSVTGLIRGLSQATGTTTVAALQFSHRRGANVKITDYPAIQIIKAQANGEDTYPNTLHYDTHPTFTATTDIVDKKYVDDTAFSGAGVIDATGAARGVVELATGAEAAASTANGTSGSLAIPATVATSTYNAQTAALRVPVTRGNGRLDPLFIAATSSSSMATTSPQMDSNGIVSWLPTTRLLPFETFTSSSVTAASTTVMKTTLPANSLGANGILHAKGYGSWTSTPSAGSISEIDLGFGSGTTTATLTCTDVCNVPGIRTQFFFDYFLRGNGTTNSQKGVVFLGVASSSPSLNVVNKGITGTSTPAIDTTVNQPFYLISSSLNSNSISFDSLFVEIIR